MERANAEDLLRSTQAAGGRARASLDGSWFPLVLFGSLTLLSASVAEVYSGVGIALVWLVGAPLAIAATGAWYWRREKNLGATTDARPYVITGIGIFVVASILGFVGRGGPLSYGGSMVAAAAGYGVFAYLARNLLVAGLAVFIAVIALGVSLIRPEHAYALVASIVGTAGVLVGLAQAPRR